MIDTVVSQLPDETPRFLRLPHPRTGASPLTTETAIVERYFPGIASLFLAYEPVPNEGEPDQKRISKVLEVHAVEPPNARSWFNGDEVVSGMSHGTPSS